MPKHDYESVIRVSAARWLIDELYLTRELVKAVHDALVDAKDTDDIDFLEIMPSSVSERLKAMATGSDAHDTV